MRYLVLADLHSNLEALKATLGYARGLGFDHTLVLGDIVGYGADPNSVIDLLRSLPVLTAIRGNHDRVAAGLSGPDDFNDAALASTKWTRETLRPDALEYLRALPEGPLEFARSRLLAHGTPQHEDTYLLTGETARSSFAALDFDLCFIGHTHYPSMFTIRSDTVAARLLKGDRVEISLEPGVRYLVNPGSLGQPRDRNPRCSFALYDEVESRVTVYRLDYPIETARRKILEAGLPAILGDRLRAGL